MHLVASETAPATPTMPLAPPQTHPLKGARIDSPLLALLDVYNIVLQKKKEEENKRT